MQLFYSEDIQSTTLTLDEAESKHARQVLRLKEGDNITVVDGNGNLYHCVITAFTKHNAIARINKTEIKFGKRPYTLHVALAPTKNIDRYEWFLEKAVEIGVDEITPIISAHSERKLVKTERSLKILISAMKQSVKATLPKLNEPTLFGEFIKMTHQNLFIAHCSEDNQKQPLHLLVEPDTNHTILIGPEGDFTDDEITMARMAGARAISLGSERLRTETAGVVAVHTVNLITNIKKQHI